MKFIVMHKADANSEAEVKPTQELIANVGGLVKSAMESGKFIDAAGLRSSALRVRVKLAGDERTLQKGPYEGDNELVSDIALLKVETMEQAIDWGTRFARAASATDLEIGPVTEPWDLGLVPKPSGEVPLQVLALLKATSEREAGRARSVESVERFVAEAREAQVLVSAHTLLPSAKGTRIRGKGDARRIVDGPFSETKELVGGFMILDFDSQRDAIGFAKQYADIVGAEEVDVRPVQ